MKRCKSIVYRILILLAALIAGVSATAAKVAQEGVDVGRGLRFEADTVGAATQTFEVGVASKGDFSWCLTLYSDRDTLAVAVERGDSHRGDIDHQLAAVVSVRLNGVTLCRESVSEGVDFNGFPNYLIVRLDGDMVAMDFGDRVPRQVAEVACGGFFGIAEVTSQRDARLVKTAIRRTDAPVITRSGYDSVEALMAAVEASDAPYAGVWRYYDCALDTANARRGGDYTLATLPDGDGGYYIIYVDGAATNAATWLTGDIKGWLIPSAFDGNFTLRWLGSDGFPIADEAYVIFDNSLLTAVFPLLAAKLRFTPIPTH